MAVQLSPRGDLSPRNQLKLEVGSRLHEIEERINTWRNHAFAKHVDIHEEESVLQSLEDINHLSTFNLLLREKCEERLCKRIINKVRTSPFEPDEEALQSLQQELTDLKVSKVIPWIQKANEFGVDIEDETYVLIQAEQDSYQLLSEKPSKQRLEVIQTRLKTLHTQCLIRIIPRIVAQMIRQHGKEEINNKPFEDERVSIIHGIAEDACKGLPTSGLLNRVESRCLEIFQLFKDNTLRYDENPEEYHKEMDRDVLRRQFLDYANQLLSSCRAMGNQYLLNQISEAKEIGERIFEDNLEIEELKRRLEALDIFAERVTQSSGARNCGFQTQE